MTIIKSIDAKFGGVTFNINNTNYHARLNGSIMTGIIYIHEVGESWNDNTDVRIMTARLNDINRMSDIINTTPYVIVDYEDKHCYMNLEGYVYNVNSDYTFLEKEAFREIKGGSYRSDTNSISKNLSKL